VRAPDGTARSLQPKRLALLAYLAVVTPRGVHRRDTLLALFWPDQDAESARGALRQALKGLRQVLPAGVVVTRGDDVGLDPAALACDVWAFEDAVERAELERAASFYRAPFLEGFFLSDCPAFERWVDGERDRLARANRRLIEQIAERAGQGRDRLAAVSWWRRVSAQDPYSTRVALRVMEALEAAGDRAGALQYADEHAARLRADLGAEPAPEVVALADHLRAHPVRHPSLRTHDDGGTLIAGPPERLEAALAGRYTVQRELGAGGMATVYLAEDLKHHRLVAIKVLRPELAAAIGPELFLREIEITARLDHPHILPLLDSGEANGFLYYVMPYVKGESLRDRLQREKQLPIEDALQIAREVADALDFAHRQDVLHRDIKPENILLGAGHARVADFGIARAISAAGGDRLTETGFSVGTPAYMSPEHAGGQQPLDGRSDIYALGCVLYEMLAGQPPFTGPSLESVVQQHLAAEPPDIAAVRPAVPAGVANALQRALIKTPADRYATVVELQDALRVERLGTHEAPRAAIRLAALIALLAVGVSAAILGLIYVLMIQLGLPDWILHAAIGLLGIGLPIIVLTGYHERQRALSRTAYAMGVPPTGVERYFTWRRSVLGSGLAFAGLGVVAAGYMTMRALGIGPAATLVSAGVLEERAPIIIADFENRTADSLLGPAVTEALRVDLGQSPVVTLLAPREITGVLRSMDREPDAPLDAALAREIAMREGLAAIVVGDIIAAGAGYVLSLRLLSPADGTVLTGVRETARDETEVIAAIDELSAKLRERIGESLKSIRPGPPLGRVTTTSLEALQKYSQAIRALEVEEDPDKGRALLEEAVALDTAFAMAYRKLAVSLPFQYARSSEALTKAFAHRDRLTEVERLHVESVYYSGVLRDPERAAAVYRRFVDTYPDSTTAWSNLGANYGRMREWALAEEAYLQAIARGPGPGTSPYVYAMFAQVAQGAFERAESTLALMAADLPEHPNLWFSRASLAFAQGEYEEAAAHVRELRPANLFQRAMAAWWRATYAKQAGRLAEAERHLRDHVRAHEARQDPRWALLGVIDLALLDVWLRRRPTNGVRRIEQALDRYPLDSLPPADRPYLNLAAVYALAGRLQDARHYMEQFEDTVDPAIQRIRSTRYWAEWEIALAEGRFREAVRVAERADSYRGLGILRPLLYSAVAYDRAGAADSALAYHERYLTTPVMQLDGLDAILDSYWRARNYRRLGELYEARGDSANAVESYNEFVELWKDADPELQPQVEDVRARIARLAGSGK
jgi:DNA-binding SARP family transcriptional activator